MAPGAAVQRGRALGMADEQPVAAIAQLLRAVAQVGERAGARQRRLEQHPAAAGRALGDRLELRGVELEHVVPRELGAGAHLEVDVGARQREAQLAHPLGDLVHVHVGTHAGCT